MNKSKYCKYLLEIQKINKEDINKYIEYMEKNNIDVIHINDKEYPEKLKNIYLPPEILYVKGKKDILKDFSIGIIGSRLCSLYGKNISKKLSYELSKLNVNIVSGLAKGIDTYAHIGCLYGNAKTIAVLGNGLDMVYPIENQKLFNEIIKSGGAIVSEYIIGTKPKGENFPKRNRIISGLSDGIVVIEAKKKSGCNITVDYALEQGKNVFAIPGNINSINSYGTNKLIQQGAKLVTSVEDILEEYNL